MDVVSDGSKARCCKEQYCIGTWNVRSMCTCTLVTQLTLWDPVDCSPPGFSVHGILHARILEWIAVFFSRGIFLTQGSNVSLLHHRQILYHLSHQGSPRLYIVLCNLQITTDWLQIGKGVCQDYVLSPAYLTYMQSTS